MEVVMEDQGRRKVEVVRIELERLEGHPLNPNVMSEEMLGKLRRHIGATGRYEPLVVRRHPKAEGRYELLNGHHRKKVLEGLGHREADCVVWEVDDAEAAMLLATLNRIGGADDPSRRARLVALLEKRYSPETLRTRLPDTEARLARLARLGRGVEVKRPGEVAARPGAFVVFVGKEGRATIEQAIAAARQEARGDDPEGRMRKGELLAVIAGGWLRERMRGRDL